MTDTANLEDGFYWVRRIRSPKRVVARKMKDRWFIDGHDQSYPVASFREIDPRPIKREL